MAISADDVLEKLQFAKRRLDEVLALNGGNLSGSNPSERQQLLQEFFFHLIGAVDLLGQLVNDRRGLGLDPEELTFASLPYLLAPSDPLSAHLQGLYARTRNQAFPHNPYSDDAYVFRAYNYRNHVTHRFRNPFQFVLSGSPAASFLLDPRDPTRGRSDKSAQDEMSYMFELFDRRCRTALAVV